MVCDRYIYSSLAYQGSVGLSLDWIKTINARGLLPDIAFFIDLTPEQLSGRLEKREIPIESLQKARQVYLKFVKEGELISIDGNKPKDAVANERALSGLLKNANGIISN